ncbi:BON domain-containing protein [Nitrosospira multiformis]|uniref:BON domain-containing protein n=1 Tax=Nitrosospira multiformis TaxID=1231 RepID=A0A1I7IWI9_9PROT|nr:BON domain-containing protein [Nitrosospira multiformis]SFU77296.1 BON domain-containing protein [Nitrosospira multiformis]
MPFLNPLNNLIIFFLAALFVWLPACSVMAMEQLEGEFSGEKETSRTDRNERGDSVITIRVKAAISREPSLKDEEIGVETTQGNVRLTGSVSSILVMEKAVEVARGVQGVRTVKDEMQFKWQN